METYRHALYRYSTGQGFNVNVDVPEKAEEVTSYKFKPLLTRMNMNPDFTVDMLREADRISMQVEATAQVMKVIGYDEKVGEDFNKLKRQLEVMQHLITNYPVRYIRSGDLQKLFDLYQKGKPGMDKLISQVVEQNIKSTGITPYVGTAYSVRKGYPVFDRYGMELKRPEAKQFIKDKEQLEKEQGLSGVTDLLNAKMLGPVIILLLVFIYLKK